MIRNTRAFLITGLLALPVAALLCLIFSQGMGRVWPAMVHLTLFGWITAMILTVNYHTMPVFSGRDFPYPWLIWVHWAVWATGVTLVTTGLLFGHDATVTVGLELELTAALVFIANTLLLFRCGPRRAHRPPAPPIVGQAQVDRVGTQATRGAGTTLPLSLVILLAVRLGWIGGAWVLPAEHLATLGWLMLMVVGVAYHVLPRFSGHGTRGLRWARVQVCFHFVALVLMVLSLGFGWTRAFACGGLLMTVALALFAWTIWPALHASDLRHADTHFVPIAPAPLPIQAARAGTHRDGSWHVQQ